MKLPNVPSEGFLQALPLAERRKLGRAGITKAEALAIYRSGREKELQKALSNYLNLKGIYYEIDRMDRPTSGKRGRADFRCCVDGLWLSLECKSETGTLTHQQSAEAARLRKSGGKFAVVFSLQDAIDAIHDIRSL